MEVDLDDKTQNSKDESSSSSSEDEDKEEQILLDKCKELENKIKSSPYDYDSYVSLVQLYEKLADLEKLRSTYEKFSELYPLTDKLWLNWLKCETPLCSNDQQRERIYNLFEKATKDYLSTKLWLEYVQFSMGDSNVERTREIFEKACNNCGLHVTEGCHIYDAFREFELAHLSILKSTESDTSDKYLDQIKKIISIYKRQLSVPLIYMDQTFVEFRVWIEKSNIKDFDMTNFENTVYSKTKSYLEKLMPYEDDLLAARSISEEELYKVYEKYFAFERKSNPSRLFTLYERAISELPLNSDLWLNYCKELVKIGPIDLALDVCKRSVRNCPWAAQLWVLLMQTMDLNGESHEAIDKTLEQSLDGCANCDSNSHLSLWMCYLEHCRRLIGRNSRNESNENIMESDETDKASDNINDLMTYEMLSDIFYKAQNYMHQVWGSGPNGGDTNASILQYLARIGASKFQKIIESRRIWTEEIFRQGFINNANMWLEFINFEKKYGDQKHVRRAYNRAIQSVKDWPQSIYESWLSYERDYGSIKDQWECEDKCLKIIKEWNEKNENKEFDQNALFLNDKEKSNKNRIFTEKKRKFENDDYTNSKRSRHYETELNAISKIKINESKEKQFKKEKKTNKDLEKQKQDETMEVNEASENSKQKKNQDIKITAEMEQNMVFVSNLDYDVDEETLKQFILKDNQVNLKEIRLVKDYKGRSKGYAYVELSSSEEVAIMLQRDRERLNNRPVFLSPCKSDRVSREQNHTTHAFKYATSREDTKLFVKGLSFEATKGDIEEIFKPHGTIKDIRMVFYRNGHFKGIAYVEFETPEDAKRALIKTDNQIVNNHQISVAISDPPKRKDKPSNLMESNQSQQHSTMKKSRVQIPLIPTVLTKSTSIGPAKPAVLPETKQTNEKPKTNADFRAMLLGNKN